MLETKHLPIQIKGIREGLLILIGEGDWSELERMLLEQVDAQIQFYRGAKMALDVGNHILNAIILGGLRDRLSERGISLWAVLSNSPKTEQTAQLLGLATKIPSGRSAERLKSLETGAGGEANFTHKTLRSGVKIENKGHVIIVGDVNPGAEIVAGGSIFIWGKLRGVVHAGAEGDDSAVVCALEMNPTQLRIAGKVAIPPKKPSKPMPEMAFLENGQVVTQIWTSKGK